MTDLHKIWRDWRLKVDLEIEYDWRRRLSRFQRLAVYPVVKVRGNAGERRSWAPYNCRRTFPGTTQGPTQPLMIRAGWDAPSVCSRVPNCLEFLGPQTYTLTTAYTHARGNLVLLDLTYSRDDEDDVLALWHPISEQCSPWHVPVDCHMRSFLYCFTTRCN